MTRRIVNPIECLSATATSLLAGAAEQDQLAWWRLVEKYGDRVYRWIRSAGLQDADALDVMQFVFAAVARNLRTFLAKDQREFRRWLNTITQNKAKDWHRNRGRKREAALGGTDHYLRILDAPETRENGNTNHVAPSIDPTYRAVIEKVRVKCKDQTWQIFWRLTADGAIPENVADEFGVTLNAVYLIRSRVARRIRSEYEQACAAEKRFG